MKRSDIVQYLVTRIMKDNMVETPTELFFVEKPPSIYVENTRNMHREAKRRDTEHRRTMQSFHNKNWKKR